MFPVRLTDPSKTVDSSAPAQVANGSILQAQVVTANGERQKEGGMIWVDRPPEKRKRRKANLAAVEAYIKKREEERIRAESGAAEHSSGVPAEESAPVAAMNEPEVGMDVDASRAGGPGVQSVVVEVPPVRSVSRIYFFYLTVLTDHLQLVYQQVVQSQTFCNRDWDHMRSVQGEDEEASDEGEEEV